jgi:hypothetical protein
VKQEEIRAFQLNESFECCGMLESRWRVWSARCRMKAQSEYRASGVTLEGGARALLLPQAVLRSMYAPS